MFQKLRQTTSQQWSAIAACAAPIAAICSVIATIVFYNASYQSGIFTKQFDMVVEGNDSFSLVFDFVNRCQRLITGNTGGCSIKDFDKVVSSQPWSKLNIEADMLFADAAHYFNITDLVFDTLYDANGNLDCRQAEKLSENLRRFNLAAVSTLKLENIEGRKGLLGWKKQGFPTCMKTNPP